MKAICRVSKIKGAGSMAGKSTHNYRLAEVPNADPQRQHLNQEYINPGRNLVPAIETRIHEAGIKRIRHDAVKGMEFILTASPERFPRDENGQVNKDIRNSKWVAENLRFMKEKYGPNLVAFTLHQDEKTPHIHAVVVPITADGRLSAKELFNPRTLRQLQTEYAQAMKPFGLERGTEGSRARHVSMKQIYGMQQAERQAVQRDLAPLSQEPQPLTIDKPGTLDLLNLERWKQQQEAKINAEYTRKLKEVEKAAQKAQKIAVANATAKQERKVLKQRLDTTERLKQANHEKAHKTGEKLATVQGQLEQVAVYIEQGILNPEWSKHTAEQVRARVVPKMEADIVAILKEKTTGIAQVSDRIQAKGYQFTGQTKEGFARYVQDPASGVQLELKTTKFGGQLLTEAIAAAIERTRQEELKKEKTPQVKQGRGMRM